ncbi:MAG: bifunctional diaminohydroxyphosphoribosylaminopyrimidine deaminase/5-amino-6-(5-phosphoribosylamino)uracil reductase RibD [Anaerocolumna sp.]
MDIKFMERALELAQKGIGYTNPNPLVGAVIVKDGKIIGEGYHEFFGGPHAEINAFKNAVEDISGATMYVTLEPCSHYGKTPPCAEAILKKGIKKVVIALQDPNPQVSGRGIKLLRDNGIEVITGVLEEKSSRLNEIFLKYITSKLPFCILKSAMTLDGKTAAVTGDSKWITNEESREYVHRLRHRVSAIMTGVGTVIQDDPFLNTRLSDERGRDPIRVIVDSSARIPISANVLNLDSKVRTIIATTVLASDKKLSELGGKGAEIIVTPLTGNNRVDLKFLMKALGERAIDSILLEGGSELNFSAIESGIVDKINVFIAPKLIGGSKAKTPVGGAGRQLMKDAVLLKDTKTYTFGDNVMIEGYF